jgi:hypothetical protein
MITVCAQLHFNIPKEMEVKFDIKNWYQNVPKFVETSHKGKVLWY